MVVTELRIPTTSRHLQQFKGTIMSSTDIYSDHSIVHQEIEHNKNIIKKLIEIRKNPRKMRETYLRSADVYNYIFSETEGEEFAKFNIRERMDFIINGKPNLRCHCGNRVKIGAVNCSAKCTGNNPANKANSSAIQKSNAADRWIKTQKTNLEKYGVYHNNHIESCKVKRDAARVLWVGKMAEMTFSRYGLDIENYNTVEKLTEVIASHASLDEVSSTFNGMPKMTIYRHMCRYNVSTYHKQTSGGERELSKFIESLGFQIQTSNRILIKPLELDIVIIDKKIAVEFDGVYWHSEKAGKDKFDPKKHLIKTRACAESGYQLIHIFENDWKLKSEICKSIISAKLGVFQERVYARNCNIELMSHLDAREFFERTHIQGYSQAKFTMCLKIDNKIVLACSFGKPRFSKESDWELIRFSSELHTNVVGGFGKILSYFKKNYAGTLLTYCDMKFSTGATYAKFGQLIRQTPPGYGWHSMTRDSLSRHQTQKHKLKKLFPASYSDSKTENEILSENGFYKLYDCGNLVFQL